ncbi:hypothetical protein BDM02DRAFT_3115001 [Thelephora ganbajun]|uniref:Uncharacterized protein n=1 Tax=Thelephora ganbajun TaxID=370292 RepID=A0ACB6ZGI6_THEGA|nr:hypothetical protein BDM02DRAFT_3115001 [Thelephora ganbajun]
MTNSSVKKYVGTLDTYKESIGCVVKTPTTLGVTVYPNVERRNWNGWSLTGLSPPSLGHTRPLAPPRSPATSPLTSLTATNMTPAPKPIIQPSLDEPRTLKSPTRSWSLRSSRARVAQSST